MSYEVVWVRDSSPGISKSKGGLRGKTGNLGSSLILTAKEQWIWSRGADLSCVTDKEWDLWTFFVETSQNKKQWGKSTYTGSSKLALGNKLIFFSTTYNCTLYMQFSQLNIVGRITMIPMHNNLACDPVIASLFCILWKRKDS